MTKKVKGIIITTVILALGLVVAVTAYTGYQVTEGVYHLVSREETVNYYKDHYQADFEAFKASHPPQALSLPSSQFDHRIPLLYYDLPEDKGLVVMAPGLGAVKEETFAEAAIFMDLGYDFMVLDMRNAGENMAELNTFGYLESRDLLDVLAYSRTRNDKKTVLYGQSMGGLAAALAAGQEPGNIDYLILDCPVGNAYEMIEPQFDKIAREEKIPKDFLLFAGNLVSKLRYGFDFHDFNGPARLADTKLPVLILNAKADQVTPYQMGEDYFKALQTDQKEWVAFEGAGHTELYKEDPALYKQTIEKFLGDA
ncbi:alpha/beta hydrolase [Peptococcus simiae]|uniref:Alpha/beta hydrolase n=1 Tax=Peptococcus simiae TaxID=1643805 RepID=A0ABW9H0D1_9FIRM